MADSAQLPFHSFSFTLVENRRPRTALRLSASDGGMYELHVEKGSAANPTSQFTRSVPVDVAQRFKDALQDIGVFGWEESYDGGQSRGSRRWSVSTVFKEGVFSVASRGGDAAPAGFDALLEELYRLDFPRPASGKSDGGQAPRGVGSAMNAMGLGSLGSIGGMSAGDLGAFAASGGQGGMDPSKLAGMLGRDLPEGFDPEDLTRALSEMQGNPQAFQQQMREEFRHMSHEEQERMLDTLASMGMASRAWWERFLRC